MGLFLCPGFSFLGIVMVWGGKRPRSYKGMARQLNGRYPDDNARSDMGRVRGAAEYGPTFKPVN